MTWGRGLGGYRGVAVGVAVLRTRWRTDWGGVSSPGGLLAQAAVRLMPIRPDLNPVGLSTGEDLATLAEGRTAVMIKMQEYSK